MNRTEEKKLSKLTNRLQRRCLCFFFFAKEAERVQKKNALLCTCCIHQSTEFHLIHSMCVSVCVRMDGDAN